MEKRNMKLNCWTLLTSFKMLQFTASVCIVCFSMLKVCRVSKPLPKRRQSSVPFFAISERYKLRVLLLLEGGELCLPIPHLVLHVRSRVWTFVSLEKQTDSLTGPNEENGQRPLTGQTQEGDKQCSTNCFNCPTRERKVVKYCLIKWWQSVRSEHLLSVIYKAVKASRCQFFWNVVMALNAKMDSCQRVKLSWWTITGS